jgi:hypothetical protein
MKVGEVASVVPTSMASRSGSLSALRRAAAVLSVLSVVGLLSGTVSASMVGSLGQVDVEVNLPEISFTELAKLDKSTALRAADSLVSLGAIQITDIPNFHEAREAALGSLAECMRGEDDIPSKNLKDGSTRKMIDAPSTEGKAGTMSHKCGEAASQLRSLVDIASYQLFASLDTIANSKPLMAPYQNFVELSNHGDHLEHLHAYYGPEEVSSSAAQAAQDIIPAMELHTDSGLFIAMTTGTWNYVPSTSSVVGGVYLQTPSGILARMKAADDAVIFMIGEGGANWLAPVFDRPLRAVPHLLVADVSLTDSAEQSRTRSWYGKMFLPPKEVVIPGLDAKYEDLKRSQVDYLNNKPEKADTLTLGCGNTYAASTDRRGHNFYLDATMDDCGPDTVQCWMQCMPTAGLPCGMDAVCVDVTTNEVVPGNEMCPTGTANCALKCEMTPENATGFCMGSGQSMDMIGFQVTGGNSKPPCFNLLFTTWTLSSEAKFAAGCIGTFALGMIIQLLTQYRTHVAKSKTGGVYNKLFSVFLYGLQVVLSYFLMLIAMTYSAELFAMVIVGLTVGYGLVNLDLTPLFRSNAQSATNETCCGDTEGLFREKLVD